jgi:DNA-binding MarR family transcriptional regulator
MATAIGAGFRGPDGRVGYLLRQAHQAFRAAAQAELGPLGLTVPQYSILSVADAEPGLSGAELARDSMLTPQTTNEIVTLLIKADLLERRPDAHDKRLRRMYATARGHDLVVRARRLVHAVEHRMTTSLVDDDLARLRGWLSDCALNLADGADAEENAS